VGGGSGYPTFSAATATRTITTLSEFLQYVPSASPNSVFFIPSGTTITITHAVTIPAGVTIAGDRGANGSAGGILTKTSNATGSWMDAMLIIGGDNVRITGLQLVGECFDEGSEGNGESHFLIGIKNPGGFGATGYGGLEVDNCEIHGWAYAGVFTEYAPTATRTWVHHCYIHGSQNQHEGYGVNVNGGDCLIEGNIFDRNRHDISAGGLVGEQYTARYNHFLGNGRCGSPYIVGAYHVDVHANEYYSGDPVQGTPNEGVACAGSEYHIYNNTVDDVPSETFYQMAFVHIRDIPTVGAYVNNNLINTNWGQSSDNDGAQSAIYQSCDFSTSFGGMICKANMWNGTLYPDNGIVWYQSHQ